MSASLDPPTCDIASHEAEPAPSTSESPAACTGAEAADTIDDDDAYALGSCMPADELAEPPGKKVRMVDLGWFGYASPDDSGLYRAASSASSVYAPLSMQPFSPARVDHPWTRAAWHAANGAGVVWKVHAAYDFMSENELIGHAETMLGTVAAISYKWGVTHKLATRWSQYLADRRGAWDTMFLLHVSDSWEQVAELEEALIRRHSSKPACANHPSGIGAGVKHGVPPHCLYVVLRLRRMV